MIFTPKQIKQMREDLTDCINSVQRVIDLKEQAGEITPEEAGTHRVSLDKLKVW